MLAAGRSNLANRTADTVARFLARYRDHRAKAFSALCPSGGAVRSDIDEVAAPR